jgi:hypothetical protein
MAFAAKNRSVFILWYWFLQYSTTKIRDAKKTYLPFMSAY